MVRLLRFSRIPGSAGSFIVILTTIAVLGEQNCLNVDSYEVDYVTTNDSSNSLSMTRILNPP